MRGYIFELKSDHDELCMIRESDYYDKIGELCAEYVEDIDEEQSGYLVEGFIDRMHDCGFETGIEDGHPYFVVDEDGRKCWFKGKLEQAKKLMEELTLEEFAKDDDYKAYQIGKYLNDDYEDTVDADYVLYESLDTFIRNAEAGKKYYIGPVVVKMK